MKIKARHCLGILLTFVLCASCALAGGKKNAVEAGSVVDSGSYSLYQDGKLVSRESFTIRQVGGASITDAALSLDGGKPVQKFSLRMSSAGQLIVYQWSAQEAGRNISATVQPAGAENYLQQTTTIAGAAPEKKDYLSPSTAAILDEYFVSQRQLLLWRYLASSCNSASGSLSCKFSPDSYGAVSPQLRKSFQATINYVGDEPIHYKDADRKLHHFRVTTSGGAWSLWLDDQHKILRVVIEETGSEILRD